MKKEEINSSNGRKCSHWWRGNFWRKYKEEMAKIEEIQEKEAPKEIKNSEFTRDICWKRKWGN